MIEEKNNHPQHPKRPQPKRDITRYLLVIPLVILAGWLLQRSPLFGSDNKHDYEMAEATQHERLRAMEEDLEEKAHKKEKDFKLNLTINGDQVTIENLEDLKKLESLGEEFEKMGKEFEKVGEEFEKNFKETFVKELNKSIKEWKKEDLPKLKRKLKKLKKVLGKELKENLAEELKNVDDKDLDQHEKELLKHLNELVKSLNED